MGQIITNVIVNDKTWQKYFSKKTNYFGNFDEPKSIVAAPQMGNQFHANFNSQKSNRRSRNYPYTTQLSQLTDYFTITLN